MLPLKIMPKFQSRNRESSNFKSISLRRWWNLRRSFNLVIESLLISRRRHIVSTRRLSHRFNLVIESLLISSLTAFHSRSGVKTGFNLVIESLLISRLTHPRKTTHYPDRFNLVIESLLISRQLLMDAAVARVLQFQSRNRESSNFKQPCLRTRNILKFIVSIS